MGTISIDVPGDMNAQYKVENLEVLAKIIRMIKNTGNNENEMKQRETPPANDGIIGMWSDRYPQNVPSETIQKELREKTWKRF